VQPTLIAYLPERSAATGTAVVVCPGGGFHALSINSEGLTWRNGSMPTIFIAAATDDQLGLAPDSVNLYSKWIGTKKPAELHLYSRGCRASECGDRICRPTSGLNGSGTGSLCWV
jgi:hypothetical protein